MSNSYRQLVRQLPVSRLSVDVLLALRIILDDQDETKLRKEIQLIAIDPERLKQRFRPEWEVFVANALVHYAHSHSDLPADELFDGLLHKIDQLQRTNSVYQTMLKEINNAEILLANEVPRPDPVQSSWRQQVMALLLPVTTLDKGADLSGASSRLTE